MFKKLFGKIFGVREMTTEYRCEAYYDEEADEMGENTKVKPFKAYFNISTKNDRIFEVTGRKFERLINARRGNTLSDWNTVLEEIRNEPSQDYEIHKSGKVNGNNAYDVKSKWENEKFRFIITDELVLKFLNYDPDKDLYRKCYTHVSK